MSDTDSIMFHEHDELASVHNSLKADSRAVTSLDRTRRPADRHPKAAVSMTAQDAKASHMDAIFDRPPLHDGAKHASAKMKSPSPRVAPRGEQHGTPSVEHDDLHSERSESIQFQMEPASRNTSMVSIPTESVGLPKFVSNPSPSASGMSAARRDAAPRSVPALSTAIGGGSDSIQFTVDHSSTASPRAKEQMGWNQSIQFQVEDVPEREDAAKAGASSAPHSRPKQALQLNRNNRLDESSVSTILFDVEESANETNKKDEARFAGSHKQEAADPTGKKTVVSNRIKQPQLSPSTHSLKPSNMRTTDNGKEKKTQEKRLAEAEPHSLAMTLRPDDSQKTSNQSTSPDLPAIEMEINKLQKYMNQKMNSKGNRVGKEYTVAERSSRRNSTPIIVEDLSPSPLPLTGRGERARKEAPLRTPKERRRTAVPQPSVANETETLPRDGRVYRTDKESLTDSQDAHRLDEALLEAQLLTEHWRLFNDIQRDQIEGIIRRIMEARAADCIPSKLIKQGRSHPGTAPPGKPHGPASNSTAGTKLLQRGPPPLSGSYIHLQLGRKDSLSPRPRNTKPPSPVPRSMSAKTKRAAPHAGATPRDRKQSPLTKTKESDWFSRFCDDETRDAPTKLASSLGVSWPPRSRDELFFLTGKRLTPKQREEFYEVAGLQAATSERIYAEVWRKLESESRKKPSKTRQKRKTTRTFILRQAFALLDVDKRGEVYATEFPALRRLLESERAYLEGKATRAEAALLYQARCEQKTLKGSIDAQKPTSDPSTAVVTPPERAGLILYAFVLDVILPLLYSSGMVAFDFTAVALLVFGSLDASTRAPAAHLASWQQTALRHFEVLT